MPGDLDPLFDPPPSGGAQPLSYRQGTVVTFNQVTLQNTVLVGRTVMTDLPLLGVAEADTLAPGSTVGLVGTGADIAIIGRFVRPNTSQAFDAINRMGSRTQSAQVATSESTTSTSYTNLATAGPTVTATVTSSGLLLVIVSADIISDKGAVVGGGLMTVQVADSGGSIVYAAGSLSLPILHFMFSDNAVHAVGDSMGTTRLGLVTLSPGTYTVTAKYSAESSGANCSFANRNVTCIAI